MHLLEWVFKIEETALTSMLQCKIILSMLLPSLPVLKISSRPVIPDDQRVYLLATRKTKHGQPSQKSKTNCISSTRLTCQ